MSTVDLIDLDVLAPPDRHVKVGGQAWRVPGDPPTGWLLAFRSLTAKFADDVDELEVVEQLRDAIVDLFLLRQPDAEDDILKAVDSLGVPALVGAVNSIYAAAIEPEAEPASRPTRAGTRSTSAKTRATSSASSSSSAS